MSFEKPVIDVSVYQGNIDWPQVVASGIYAAVLRAGYGREISQEDKKFKQNYDGAVAAGMPVGVYWFSYAKDPADAVNEAKACLAVLAGRELQMPLYFDQEEASIPAQNRTACAVAFLDYIRENSEYMTGYYTYAAYFPSVDISTIQKACDTIWLADYRANYDKTIPRDMHQYSSSGSVPGIAGRVDMNRLFRDFVSETKGEFEMDLSFDTYKIGPVSEGDRRGLVNFAESLGIAYLHQGDYILIGPASLGDRKQVVARAEALGLGVEGVALEAPAENGTGEDKPETGGHEGEGEAAQPAKSITIAGASPAQAAFLKALAGLWGLEAKGGE